jgi:putative transposase
MATFAQILYHIVFSTKNRDRVLSPDRREDLFRYVWGILKNKQCHLYRIGGTSDHVHILTSLHPTVCLADLVREIKTSASKWIKENRVFPRFRYWQEGYSAFTLSAAEKQPVTDYIKGQDEHHRHKSFLEELRGFLVAAGVEFDEKHFP